MKRPGYSGEAAQKSYNEFYKILGDTDTATEASQLLAQLAQNEQDITKWTNIAAGVYGTFGDALPIEGMIESANETAKVGRGHRLPGGRLKLGGHQRGCLPTRSWLPVPVKARETA